MPIAPSFQDLLTQFQAEAQARRAALVFAPGDITVAMQHGAAAMADAVIRFAAQAFKETFIDGATGDALTTLVNDHYNLQRNAAIAAQGGVTFSRTTATAAGTIPTGTILATSFDADGNSIEYELLEDVTIPASGLGPFPSSGSASVRALTSGLASNAEAGTIDRLISTIVFEPTLTVTNQAATAGGTDEESDEDLRTRARNFFTTLRRGTLAALEFGAIQTPSAGVAVATATENTDGTVTVRVTDANGNSTLQMVADVEAELENWRCAGTVVNVVGGNQALLNVTVTIPLAGRRAGFDVLARNADIIGAVFARARKLQAGETFFLDSLIASVIAVAPDDIFDVEVTSITLGGVAQPIADIVPAIDEVIRPQTVFVVAGT